MLDWKDGQPFSKRYNDVYFSSDSGIEETRHVFLESNRLAERFAKLSRGESICIGETGFGTGLNFLCAWKLFDQVAPFGASLDFFSVEKYPLCDKELFGALALWPELEVQVNILLTRWHRYVPGWNRWSFAGGRVRLTLVIADVAEALPQLPEASIDVWFLDGFSPSKNPEMWSKEVLVNVARASRGTATFATYTSAGWVRRSMEQAGFEVEKVRGFGKKREMLKGQIQIQNSLHQAELGESRFLQTAIIIGGGIAGCAAAHALAKRGISVTLLESAPMLGSAASGNPRGILHARFGTSINPSHRFVLAAYGHALSLYDEVLPVDGVTRSECGLLQLAINDVETKRISRLAEIEWPAHLMQFVDETQASQLVGVEMNFGGIWFPAGGWLDPSKVCMALASDVNISTLFGYHVENIDKTDSGWQVNGHIDFGKTWKIEADVVLVCCAYSAKKLVQFANFPLTPVRGQITIVPQTQSSRTLQAVVCGDGYCAPASDGVHVIGATHTFADESTEIRFADHAENLANLSAYAPCLHEALGDLKEQVIDGRASVRCSAPGAMPMVGKIQDGLYCSIAHSTRGFLSAGIAGEVLAAQICGQLPPLSALVIAALEPSPRVSK